MDDNDNENASVKQRKKVKKNNNNKNTINDDQNNEATIEQKLSSGSRCSVPDNSKRLSFKFCSFLLYASITMQCLLSPFTKVEESFNSRG